MNLQDDFTKQFQEKVTFWQKRLADLSWIPILDIPHVHATTPRYGYRIAAPFDRRIIVQIPQLLKDQGWEMWYELKEQDADGKYDYPYQSYRKKIGGITRRIDVMYFDFGDGVVCKRQQIGTETVEQPVYEFACEEA